MILIAVYMCMHSAMESLWQLLGNFALLPGPGLLDYEGDSSRYVEIERNLESPDGQGRAARRGDPFDSA